VVLVPIKLNQFLTHFRLVILLPPVISRNEPVNVLLVLLLLLKYVPGVLVVIHHVKFRFFGQHQLNTQEPFIFLVIVPYEIVIH
jgi:hypothetical protein